MGLGVLHGCKRTFCQVLYCKWPPYICWGELNSVVDVKAHGPEDCWAGSEPRLESNLVSCRHGCFLCLCGREGQIGPGMLDHEIVLWESCSHCRTQLQELSGQRISLSSCSSSLYQSKAQWVGGSLMGKLWVWQKSVPCNPCIWHLPCLPAMPNDLDASVVKHKNISFGVDHSEFLSILH